MRWMPHCHFGAHCHLKKLEGGMLFKIPQQFLLPIIRQTKQAKLRF